MSQSVDTEQLQRENEELRRQLAAKNSKTLTFKVSPKRAVSIYGLQRFPTTLYGSQWLALLQKVDELKKFIEDHRAELDWK